MFSKPLFSVGALVLATVATAKPIPSFTDLFSKRGDSHSFNNYGGYGSMSSFDNFYGSSDYSGTSQTLVKNKEVVCHTEKIEIVQQQLAVIREYYKKIITEQICEVEVQTIVHEQFVSGCEGFSDDLRRKSSRDVSYDHNVASQICDIHDSSNECVTNNLGWHGYEVGSNACSYSGDNWNKDSSPSSVDSVYSDCQQSYNYCSPSYASEWSSSYSAPSYDSYSYEAPSYEYSTYEAPSYSYSYESPSYDYTYESSPSYEYTYDSSPSYEYTYEAPSYDYTYETPSYEYTYEAPSYTYAPSYDSGYSYEAAPPTYTSAYYGYGSSPSYGSEYGGSEYGGSEYGGSEYGGSDVSSDPSLTDCLSSCGSGTDVSPTDLGSALPSDSAAATLPTESAVSAPAATDSSVATDTAAPAATDSASAAASPAASSVPLVAATSAPAAAATASA